MARIKRSKSKLRRWHFILPAVAVVLCCCNHLRTSRAGTDAEPPPDGREYSLVKAENGKTALVAVETGEKAVYPRDFPFPQYPGSRVTLSLSRPGRAPESVNLETSDTPDKAVAYYKIWFENNGWKISQQSSTPGMAAISACNGDRLASIMSMPETGASGQNSIQITLSSSK